MYQKYKHTDIGRGTDKKVSIVLDQSLYQATTPVYHYRQRSIVGMEVFQMAHTF